MKRISSKPALLKHRVRVIHRRAKFAGTLYFLGTVALAALVALATLLDGTVLAATGSLLNMPATSFYKPVTDLLKESPMTTDGICNALVAVLYGILLLVAVINVLRALSKLNWLFKRKASYTNGFNRNMYAMDDLAKCFSSSFSAILILYLQIYILTATAATPVKLNMAGLAVLAVGFFLHFLCGLVGGNVTLFTTADQMEEEPRENGVFVFFVRNVIQVAAVAAIAYVLLPQSELLVGLKEIVYNVVECSNVGWLTQNLSAILPTAVELLAWICVFVLVKHAASETEYNRDGLDGAGMKNFTVFALFGALFIAAIAVLPMLNVTAALSDERFKAVILAAGIALVAFLFDCIVKPRTHGAYDDIDIEAYFRGGNTII